MSHILNVTPDKDTDANKDSDANKEGVILHWPLLLTSCSSCTDLSHLPVTETSMKPLRTELQEKNRKLSTDLEVCKTEVQELRHSADIAGIGAGRCKKCSEMQVFFVMFFMCRAYWCACMCVNAHVRVRACVMQWSLHRLAFGYVSLGCQVLMIERFFTQHF